MATTISTYDHVSELLANAAIDLDGATLKLALVSSAYTYSATDTQWSQASANEVSGTGYTAGGQTVTGATLTRSGGTTTLSADDVIWTALSATFRAGVLYASGTYGGIVDPLLAYVLYDDTPADVTVSGLDFVTKWNASGIFRIGRKGEV